MPERERERERRVEARLRRQALLTRSLPEPPRLEAVLSEAVLLATGYGPAIMSEQLRHLAEMAELPHMSIRVVPLAAGVHPGAITGAFVLLNFPNRSWPQAEPPMVYRELLRLTTRPSCHPETEACREKIPSAERGALGP